jgi:putative addiction module component (TIGR02574 family)
MTKQQLLDEAKSLPKKQRIEMAMELWDSIETGVDDATLTDDHRRELDHRLSADEADGSPPEDWQALRAKLLRGEL